MTPHEALKGKGQFRSSGWRRDPRIQERDLTFDILVYNKSDGGRTNGTVENKCTSRGEMMRKATELYFKF